MDVRSDLLFAGRELAILTVESYFLQLESRLCAAPQMLRLFDAYNYQKIFEIRVILFLLVMELHSAPGHQIDSISLSSFSHPNQPYSSSCLLSFYSTFILRGFQSTPTTPCSNPPCSH